MSRGLGLLTRYEAGRRNRRPADAVLALGMSVVAGLAAVVADEGATVDENVGGAVVTVLGWAGTLERILVLALLVLAAAILLDLLVNRRWALARDALLAFALLAGAGSLLGRAVSPDWFAVDSGIWSLWGFPDYRLAVAVALATVVGPDLVAPARRLLVWLIVAAAVAELALGAALPSHLLAAAALGLGIGALVRLVFGSAVGVPPSAAVRDSMAELGVELDDLRPVPHQELGAATYVGRDRLGPVRVRVLGRDAQDTQRLARRWRLLAYRDPPRSAPIGRLEQVEHEALATLMAAQAGVRVPAVVMAALGNGGSASLVTRQPDVDPLGSVTVDEVPDSLLLELWRQVATLHAAGISHGRLNTSQVVIEEGRPTIVGFGAATLGAPAAQLDIDVAELMVSSTVLVGADRALAAAIEGAGQEAVRGALPYLQRAALTPHTRDLARSHEVELDALRTAAADATGTEAAQIAPLHRIRLRNLLGTVAIGVAAYLLITQLADIGFDRIADSIRTADPAWLVAALVIAQLALVPEGVSLRGAVPTPLPLLPCVALKSAQKFINLAIPGAAGTIAATVRFVQHNGGTSAEAVASSAIDDVSEKVVQLCLVLLMVPLAGIALDDSEIRLTAPDSRLLAAVGVALLVSLAVVALVPRIRAKVGPRLREAVAAFRAVLGSRRNRLQLFGGNLAGELTYALTLGAVCHAYGVGLSLSQLVLINVGASVLAGLIPAPGGVGAGEATLTAGLLLVGVSEPTAFAIAISHRLCTNYLPPLWGWTAFAWLRRNAYI